MPKSTNAKNDTIIDFNNYKSYEFIYTILKVMKANSSILLFKRREIIDLVIKDLNIPQEQIEQYTVSNGLFRIENRIHWAIVDCKILNYIESPQSTLWKLTNKAIELSIEKLLDRKFIRQEINNYNTLYRNKKLNTTTAKNLQEDTSINNETIKEGSIEEDNIEDKWINNLREIIQYKMSPTNFEKFCLSLVKSLGVDDPIHTGGKGDNGIDGEGLLVADDFINYKIGFQFKKYAPNSNVASSEIREFRGSLSNYDKGVFITSSYFTQDARLEAKKDTKIRLINFEDLCELIKKSKIFVKEKIIYELDDMTLGEFIDL